MLRRAMINVQASKAQRAVLTDRYCELSGRFPWRNTTALPHVHFNIDVD